MNDANIAQASAHVQHLQTVYCPMCEIWHENNSWCQAPCIYEPVPQSYSEATQRHSEMTMEGHS